MFLQSLAVFCGSKSGNNPLFEVHTTELGRLMAQHHMTLVYGGGNVGLMGAVADAVMAGGGKVVGIIPEHLRSRERQHEGITDLRVVPDMHVRKKMMYEMCDAAVILPGGFGTMDEMFEMLTWNQLAIHNKPIFILNSAGFYTDLFQLMHTMHQNGFLYDTVESRAKIFNTPDVLMEAVVEFKG